MKKGQVAVLLVVLLVAVIGIVLLFTGVTGKVAWSTACVRIGQQCKAVVLGQMDQCNAQCVNKAGNQRPAFQACVDDCLMQMMETCAGNCNPRCLSSNNWVVSPFQPGTCNIQTV